MGDVQYHVHRLEKGGRVQLHEAGPLQVLLSDGPLRGEAEGHTRCSDPGHSAELLLHMLAEPGSNQDALVQAAGVSQPTVSWHLKRLILLGIVQKEQAGRTSGYRVAEGSASDIALYMMNYHPTVWERWSSRLADIFITYSDRRNREETGRENDLAHPAADHLPTRQPRSGIGAGGVPGRGGGPVRPPPLALSISAYRKRAVRRLLIVSVAFALFAVDVAVRQLDAFVFTVGLQTDQVITTVIELFILLLFFPRGRREALVQKCRQADRDSHHNSL